MPRSPALARPARTLAERIEHDLSELWRGRPDGSFSHDEAVTLVHARMLGLIMDEHDFDPQVPQQIMDDLVADFAVHRLGAVQRALSADREKIDFLAELLAPVPELISAPIVDDGYLAVFSRQA
jgi:acyl-CoA oxidase